MRCAFESLALLAGRCWHLFTVGHPLQCHSSSPSIDPCVFSSFTSVTEAFDGSSAVNYRAEGAAVYVVLSSPTITSPVELAFPVQITSASGIERLPLFCALGSMQEGSIALWPYAVDPSQIRHSSSSQFGAASSPCITLAHADSPLQSIIRGLRALPLHEAMLSMGFEPPQLRWAPQAMPFLQSISSSLMLSQCVLTSFGVMFPLNRSGFARVEHAEALKLRGGALGLVDTNSRLVEVTIEHCTAEEGGAVFLNGGTLMMNSSVLRHNRASHRGGGISIANGVPILADVNVHSNAVAGKRVWWDGVEVPPQQKVSGGGGIYCFGVLAAALHARGLNLSGNWVSTARASVRDIGGGAAFSFCNFEIVSSFVLYNAVGGSAGGGGMSAMEDGGGLHLLRSEGRLWNTTLAWNKASRHGGGVNAEECGNVEVDNCAIKQNNATIGFGGGIRIVEPFGVLMLRDSVLSANTALTGNGGGLEVAAPASSNLAAVVSVVNASFKGNAAPNGGGGALFGSALAGVQPPAAPAVFMSGNSAKYGADVATDPRAIHLEYQGLLQLRYNEALRHGDMTVRVVDENNATVATFNGAGTVSYEAVVDATGRQQPTPASSPYTVTLQQGIGGVEGMSFAVIPGYRVTAAVYVETGQGRLRSNNFTVALLPCPPGPLPSLRRLTNLLCLSSGLLY